jgi:hypothetical protein
VQESGQPRLHQLHAAGRMTTRRGSRRTLFLQASMGKTWCIHTGYHSAADG